MIKVKNKGLFALLICIAFFITACNKGGKTGLLIPNDAGIVLHIDLAALSSKLSWAELQQTSWFTDAFNKAKDSLAKQLLQNPELSGIDPKGSLVFFMKRSGTNGYVAVEGDLKDADRFSKVLEGSNFNIKIAKDGGLSFAELGDEKQSVIYFNNKHFVFIADASELQHKTPGSEGYLPDAAPKYGIDSLKIFAKNTFALKGDQLLDSDKRFETLIADKADMHYWINSGALYGGVLPGVLSMMKFSALLDGNIGAGKVNFANGKITFDGRNYCSKEMTDFLKKYSGNKISGETLSHLPEGEVLAAFALSFPTQGLLDFIKLLGIDGFANAALAKIGVSPTDLAKALKGDYAFALSGVTVSRAPASLTLDNGDRVPYDKEKTAFDFVLGVSVGDQPSFQKLIDAFNKEVRGQLPPSDSSNKTAQKLNDKWFAVSNTASGADAFLSGGKKPDYAQPFSGHSFAGYVNLQKVFRTAIASSKDTAYKKNLELSAGFWKTISLFSDLKDGETTSKAVIELADPHTNALKQLNRYADKMYQASPKAKIEEDGITKIDTPGDTMAPSPLPVHHKH